MTSRSTIGRHEHRRPPSRRRGQYLPTENPYTGKVWARDRARQRGRCATPPSKPPTARSQRRRGRSSPPRERGRLLWQLGDLVAANAPRLAEIEQRDNGKLAAEVVAQVRYMGDYFQLLRRPRRQGAERGHPDRQEGRVRLHALRAQGRGRDHHAVELAADADELEARARARRRLHGGHQAVRVHLGVDARVRRSCSREAGFPERRRQRRHRPRPRGRRGAGHASARSRTSASPAATPPAARSTSWPRAASRR